MHEYESRSGNDQLSLYVYDQRGRYPGGVPFGNPDQLSTAMARQATENATAQHREVRITDSDDNLVYHSVAGKTIWPPEGHERFWESLQRERGLGAQGPELGRDRESSRDIGRER